MRRNQIISDTKLRQYFPMIRTREEILKEIHSDQELLALFTSWKPKKQEEFLEFCSGARGVKILYDAFFKEIMNPEYVPARLEEWLSLLLEQEVKILQVLPNDSVRIADESSLLITDIVVELANGSIANIEVQKLGYMFPGQRSACYSADLLLRQYKRVKDTKDDDLKFSYKDIKDVYTIVLYEKSPREFHAYPDIYIHRAQQQVDSGMPMELLQKYIFLPLDIFRENQHNEPIRNKLHAWLTFFSAEKPEEIVRLIEAYPEFRALYEDIYQLCRNTEKVMGMFSKELLELDRNTVQYMIDEMQDTINEQNDTIDEMQDALQKKENTISVQQDALQEKDNTISVQQNALQEKDAELENLRKQLAELQK